MIPSSNTPVRRRVAIIGGGPAGLMAAEILLAHNIDVDLFEAMPSVGRKFLMAGKGGLNITHAEPHEAFLARYGDRRPQIEPLLKAFGPAALRDWVHGLGIETFVGTSNRVFPKEMKAAPLLRSWLHRLRATGLRVHVRHRWSGWDRGALRFETPTGTHRAHADAVLLALGGASWPQLGSDGAWAPILSVRGVAIDPLRPANCGFDVDTGRGIGWSEHLRTRFAGHPLKSVVLRFTDAKGVTRRRQGEFVVTSTGVEGSLVYAFSAALRDQITADGSALIHLDLTPNVDEARLIQQLSKPRGSRSVSSHLQSQTGLKGVKTALLRELVSKEDFNDPARLAAMIKSLPLRLATPRPVDEAISSAGGVRFDALDSRLMLRALPGVFCAGEMLDWEAPTGGYLLTACFASGVVAGNGAVAWLSSAATSPELHGERPIVE